MEHNHTSRVVVLVDMDCFYCQVEERLDPRLAGKPIAVVQYNAWRGGGIIAVNYPARDRGVTRHMRGNEAKEKCSDIVLVQVPSVREKADLTKYRDAGKRVATVLQGFTDLLERASVDEAYLDITDAVNSRISNGHSISVDQLQNTHVVGSDLGVFIENVKSGMMESNLKLCIGGIISEEIRAAVYEITGYRCSAGIAHNKVLAKLACGLHKPNQQTILPQCGIEELYKNLQIRKIRSLGGKFGATLGEDLGITTMGELRKFTETDLIQRYDEKTGSWLYNIARGIDLEPVVTRLVSKSIGCCKKFPGRTALIKYDDVLHWIKELSLEISERLERDMEENNRKGKQMVISFTQEVNKKDIASSRTHVLNSYDPERISNDMLNVINKHCMREDGTYHIKYMGISAGKFEENKKNYDISMYFKSTDSVNKTCDVKRFSTPSKTSKSSILTYFTKSETKTNVWTPTSSGIMSMPSTSSNISFVTNPDYHNEAAINPENDISNTEELYNVAIPSTSKTNFNVSSTIDINTANSYATESMEDLSNLSNKTIELEYNIDEVVFSRACTTPDDEFKIALMNCNDSDTDSITDEVISSCTSRKEVQAKKSYFASFFDNVQSPAVPERNFDTSRHLDEADLESSVSTNETSNEYKEHVEETNEDIPMEENEINGLLEGSNDKASSESIQINSSSLSPILTRKVPNEYPDNFKQQCSECSKFIPVEELPSHLDYHFAVKMVREESHLYNDENRNNNVSKTIKSAKTTKSTETKRSKKKVDIRNKLTTFLENPKVDVNKPMEICAQCNKNIPVDNFLDHLDYHAAKKLHMELNSATTVTRINNSSTVPKNDKKKVKLVGTGNKNREITSFFTKHL